MAQDPLLSNGPRSISDRIGLGHDSSHHYEFTDAEKHIMQRLFCLIFILSLLLSRDHSQATCIGTTKPLIIEPLATKSNALICSAKKKLLTRNG